jgi:CRP-like cAMP-binding protein
LKISDISLLDIIDTDPFSELSSSLNKRKYNKGAIIYHPYEKENLVLIVAAGKVRVYLSYEEKEFTLAILSRGDIYTTHTRAFVVAIEDSELLVASVGKVRSMLADIPEFTSSMVNVLGHMLKNSFNIIEGLAFKDTAERLTDLLLREAMQSGTKETGGIFFHLNLTVEELGKMIGASRQTVSTLLNGLIREKLIEKRGRGNYYIPDPRRLEREGQVK